MSLGAYPLVSLEAARAQANLNIGDAKRGINPKRRLEMASTADGLTVEELFTCFTKEYVRSKGLDSAWLYETAYNTHIKPRVGNDPAELLTREDVRKVMDAARVKRPRPDDQKGAPIGGVEAARTAMRVIRHSRRAHRVAGS